MEQTHEGMVFIGEMIRHDMRNSIFHRRNVKKDFLNIRIICTTQLF